MAAKHTQPLQYLHNSLFKPFNTLSLTIFCLDVILSHPINYIVLSNQITCFDIMIILTQPIIYIFQQIHPIICVDIILSQSIICIDIILSHPIICIDIILSHPIFSIDIILYSTQLPVFMQSHPTQFSVFDCLISPNYLY